jgi:hypothetical protein
MIIFFFVIFQSLWISADTMRSVGKGKNISPWWGTGTENKLRAVQGMEEHPPTIPCPVDIPSDKKGESYYTFWI